MDLKRHESMPQMRTVMTPFPYFVDEGSPVEKARQMLRRHGIRHLPVVRGDRLLGVLAERDVEIALVGRDEQAAPGSLTVGEIVSPPAYLVGMGERLDRVLSEMARRHVDAALVVRDGKLAGIFTTTDACRHFAEVLAGLFPAGGDEAA